jgi:hypothetical protein
MSHNSCYTQNRHIANHEAYMRSYDQRWPFKDALDETTDCDRPIDRLMQEDASKQRALQVASTLTAVELRQAGAIMCESEDEVTHSIGRAIVYAPMRAAERLMYAFPELVCDALDKTY